MTSYTKTKIDRLFETEVKKNKKGVIISSKNVRKERVVEPTPRTTKKCPICKNDMFVSEGQIMSFHKACRSKSPKRKN